MIIVMEKDTYAGDGCEQTSGYSVTGLYGPFADVAAAKAWIDQQPKSYAVEFDIETVKAI